MGLEKLLDEANAPRNRTEPLSVRLPETLLAEMDQFVDEVGCTRSSLLRESLSLGFEKIRADWELAQANANKKKRAR